MKSCVDAKRRTKLTELKVGDDVKNQSKNLVKNAGTKEKLTSYWTNDLFAITKVNRPTIIVKR